MTIDVLENDAALRLALMRMLKAMGAEVRGFACTADAIAASTACPPNLFITDYFLSDPFDGVEVLAALRSRIPNVRTLLFAGDGAHDEITEAIGAGILDRLIEKPWDYREVEATIHQLSPKTA
jgi:two-component system nitrogen regulation response regulator NtrX